MQDVTAAIIYNNGKILITRRAPGEKHAGWWEFPGGKIEAGETPEMCLQRELMEELAVDTVIFEQLAESIFEYQTGAIRLLAYRVEIITGELTLRVHDHLEWAEPSELAGFNLLPADRPIAEKLAGRQNQMLPYIQKALAEQGHTASLVHPDILDVLQEDLRNLQKEQELNDFQNRLIDTRYEWKLPEVDFEIRSILLVGKKNTMTQLKFGYKGREIPVIMPPGYNEYFAAPDNMEHFLRPLLAAKGHKCRTTPMLPNKLLAARSGFAKYGRNNIAYIDGMGSFCQIFLYYTDIPVDKKLPAEHLTMAKCASCTACAGICPTGAIRRDRFLLDCKKCLTYLNEPGGSPFPDWVNPQAHHAIYGCIRCQEICPANRSNFKKPVEEVVFSEEETEILLQGGPIDAFPERLQKEIRRLNIEGYLPAVPRNLQAIFDRQP